MYDLYGFAEMNRDVLTDISFILLGFRRLVKPMTRSHDSLLSIGSTTHLWRPNPVYSGGLTALLLPCAQDSLTIVNDQR